jgi:hypothetical protein
MKTKRPLNRTLRIENLEGRSLLAGNVLASVSPEGVLNIRGGELANGLLIRNIVQPSENPEEPPRVFVAVGGVELGGAATTVNGVESFVTTGPIRGVNIELGQGDDQITFANPPPTNPETPTPPVGLPGRVNIGMGEGNDLVRGSLANGAGVNVLLGAGNDRLALGGSRFINLNVATDPPPPPPGVTPPTPGNDSVVIENSAVAGLTTIGTGGGDDSVTLRGRSGFRGGFGLRLDGGNDTFLVEGGVDAPVKFGRGLNVSGGEGDDRIGIIRAEIQGKLNINADAGADTVNLNYVSATESIFAALGAGNDSLTVANSRAPRAGFFGNDGTDAFINGGDNLFAELLVAGFEPTP